MSNEEFEKKMEFIVDQQAQSAAKIGQLEDIVARLANASLKRLEDTDEKIAALVDSQIRLTDSQTFIGEHLRNTDEKIVALVDSQIRLTEAQARTDEHLNRTDENLNRTDESLRRLIAVVDRYFSREGRNGE